MHSFQQGKNLTEINTVYHNNKIKQYHTVNTLFAILMLTKFKNP